MGMTTHVVGFKPPDDYWRKMRDVYNACRAAGVGVPEDVQKFFGHTSPDDAGVTVERGALVQSGAVVEYREEMCEGYDIHIEKLPPGVKVVRVYNSY